MSLIFHLVNRVDFITRMKGMYKDYKSMLHAAMLKQMRCRSVLSNPSPLKRYKRYFLQKTERCNYL